MSEYMMSVSHHLHHRYPMAARNENSVLWPARNRNQVPRYWRAGSLTIIPTELPQDTNKYWLLGTLIRKCKFVIELGIRKWRETLSKLRVCQSLSEHKTRGDVLHIECKLIINNTNFCILIHLLWCAENNNYIYICVCVCVCVCV